MVNSDSDQAMHARTFGRTSFHLFMVADGFLEAAGGVEFTHALMARTPPDGMRSFAYVATTGRDVVARFENWRDTSMPEDFGIQVATFYGPHTLHELLERCTWHSGQHTRQIMQGLLGLGIRPDGPIEDSLFEGLPIPEQVYA